MQTKNFTIVDVETTGGSPLMHRVIEVGILRVEKGEVVEKFKSLVNPGQEVPEFVAELTGISAKKLKTAPYFEEIAEDIFPLFEDSIFVAHNSNFDYKFMQAEFRRANLILNMETLCTVRLSRALFPQYKKHNLSTLIERFDFSCKHRHRAFDDAKVLWDFLQVLEKQFPGEVFSAAIERTIKQILPRKQQRMATGVPEVVYEDLDFGF